MVINNKLVCQKGRRQSVHDECSYNVLSVLCMRSRGQSATHRFCDLRREQCQSACNVIPTDPVEKFGEAASKNRPLYWRNKYMYLRELFEIIHLFCLCTRLQLLFLKEKLSLTSATSIKSTYNFCKCHRQLNSLSFNGHCVVENSSVPNREIVSWTEYSVY